MGLEDKTGCEAVEKRLRAVAPVLPPALRGRTLARCVAGADKRRRRGGRFLRWAFAGICVVHLAAGALLDSQYAALYAGVPPKAAVGAASGPLLACSATDDATKFRGTVLARSRMLASLLAGRRDWTPAPGAG